MSAVGIREARRRFEQRLAITGAAATCFEGADGRGDRGLERDLRGVLGGELGELGREVRPARREAGKDGALLVAEVTRHRALEEADGIGEDAVIVGLGPARGEAARGLDELVDHLVVTAMRPL